MVLSAFWVSILGPDFGSPFWVSIFWGPHFGLDFVGLPNFGSILGTQFGLFLVPDFEPQSPLESGFFWSSKIEGPKNPDPKLGDPQNPDPKLGDPQNRPKMGTQKIDPTKWGSKIDQNRDPKSIKIETQNRRNSESCELTRLIRKWEYVRRLFV